MTQMKSKRELAEKHKSMHPKPSAWDKAAVAVLETFLRSDGRINHQFSSDDKWPNSDGQFEFLPNPSISRRPERNFIVQIKGTHRFTEKDNTIKYSLQSLAFPATIYCDVTLDPGILFLVLNPDISFEELLEVIIDKFQASGDFFKDRKKSNTSSL